VCTKMKPTMIGSQLHSLGQVGGRFGAGAHSGRALPGAAAFGESTLRKFFAKVKTSAWAAGPENRVDRTPGYHA
jgi:hypothetical protein